MRTHKRQRPPVGVGAGYLQAFAKLYGHKQHSAKLSRRLPPYARRLLAVLADPASWPNSAGTSADGSRLTVTVLIGPDSWATAKAWSAGLRLFVVAPLTEDPAGFAWGLLAGCDPILVRPCGDVGSDALKSLVAALLRDGVRRVLYLGENGLVRFLSVQEAARHD